jgi:hypothetical protein
MKRKGSHTTKARSNQGTPQIARDRAHEQPEPSGPALSNHDDTTPVGVGKQGEQVDTGRGEPDHHQGNHGRRGR